MLRWPFVIAEMIFPLKAFYRSAPWPISWALRHINWLVVLAVYLAFAALLCVSAGYVLIIILENTVRYSIQRIWMASPFSTVYDYFSNDLPPMLDPVGILPDGPTIQWTIRESLVAATEATHQGVQDLLHRCVMSQTPALQLDSNTSIPCGELSRQLDAPPLMTVLRRRSRVTHETVSGELAREFKDFARFLHLLRDVPASVAYNPRVPKGGFSSNWQSIQHQLDVVYRTVWCRWLRRQPASTLESRKRQLLGLLQAAQKRRTAWQSKFADLSSAMETKNSQSCIKESCDGIEKAARALGPASLCPSSLFGVMVLPQGATSRSSSAKKGTSEKKQGQRERPPQSDQKALIEQQERSFELQKLAAKCVAKCTLLHEHQGTLGGILSWLKAEIEWWTQIQEHHKHSSDLAVEQFNMSLPADLHRFETLLDQVARTAMERKGPQ